jgi:hypothetical protein
MRQSVLQRLRFENLLMKSMVKCTNKVMEEFVDTLNNPQGATSSLES